MAETLTALTDQQLPMLQKEKFVLLSTIDAETGAPSVNAISWVYAMGPDRLRFAVDQRSRIIQNVQAHAQAAITFFGGGSVHTVNGTAKLVAEQLDGVPIKLACVEVEVASVRDVMFYGSRISVEPQYEKTYDKRAAEKLDGQVFHAMNKA
ncbi:pyridoxamine 5'-phosphate oxidase family protein [Paenibacillus aurantius]|uniref:Pyridoxamine 5'-phosphate oxidase family protein n=1 Tax=Paenibacillus aurantius TaxID=2918900 RepID=A0AA96LJZ0_9BACL|nr:pyridoxamine 5'-phosphate oxidase family protein [Paenibacillus aurantius]WNQ13490.1 pyridoxamine 5'-phosphate oxidase family protein [Paenibacillus aurantius]